MPPGTVTLAGVVRDSAGLPLSGAEVRVGTAYSAHSDSRGAFLLPGIPVRADGPDTLALVVRHIGFEPTSVRVAVARAGLRIDLVVTLLPDIVRLSNVIARATSCHEQRRNACPARRSG